MSLKQILKKLDKKKVIREILNVPTFEDIPRMKAFLAQNMIKQGLLDVELSETDLTFELSNGQSFLKPTEKRFTIGEFSIGKNGFSFMDENQQGTVYFFSKNDNIEILEDGFIISLPNSKKQEKFTLKGNKE